MSKWVLIAVKSESSGVIPSLLNGMGGQIQGEALLNLITKTLATLEVEYVDLKTLLDQELWQAAGEKAHQLKGSVYLFGCGEILFFLDSIANKNTGLIGTETFKDNFWETSHTCLKKLQEALDSECK